MNTSSFPNSFQNEKYVSTHYVRDQSSGMKVNDFLTGLLNSTNKSSIIFPFSCLQEEVPKRANDGSFIFGEFGEIRVHYLVDKQGNKNIQVKEYNGDKVISTITFNYIDGNFIIHNEIKNKYHENGQVHRREESTFDTKGLLISSSKKYYNAMGRLIYRVESECNSDGKEVSQSNSEFDYDVDGRLLMESVINYDAHGKPDRYIKISSHYDTDNLLRNKNTSEYDPQGEFLGKSSTFFSYDADGKLCQESVSNYNANGELVSESLTHTGSTLDAASNEASVAQMYDLSVSSHQSTIARHYQYTADPLSHDKEGIRIFVNDANGSKAENNSSDLHDKTVVVVESNTENQTVSSSKFFFDMNGKVFKGIHNKYEYDTKGQVTSNSQAYSRYTADGEFIIRKVNEFGYQTVANGGTQGTLLYSIKMVRSVAGKMFYRTDYTSNCVPQQSVEETYDVNGKWVSCCRRKYNLNQEKSLISDDFKQQEASVIDSLITRVHNWTSDEKIAPFDPKLSANRVLNTLLVAC